jgi:hypothetical protein
VGSSPTPGTTEQPLVVNQTVSFVVWLLNKKGNRQSTMERKIRYLKQLLGSPQDMASQVLVTSWKDRTKKTV